MRKRLAYLVGARIADPPSRPDAETPRAEYAVFAERNGATLLDFKFLEASRSRLAQSMRKKGKLQVGLAIAAADVAKHYDGLVVSGEDVGLPLTLLLMLRGSKKPVYIITHGSYFRSPRFRTLMRVLRHYKHAHFLCLADTLRRALVEEFGVSEAQAHNAGYGVDTTFFYPQPVSSAPLIASAGTASRDYRTLVKACEGLDVSVKIAADSAWFPAAVDIASDALPPNIEARSFGNYAGLRQLYADASFVIVPLYPARHACGFAVIIEAMAMGKAVIAAKTASHSDFIIDGETGYYFEPGDVDSLRSQIAHLLTNPEKARRLGHNARCLIEQRYSLAAYCGRIESIIETSG